MERCFVWLICFSILAFFWLTLSDKEAERVNIGFAKSPQQNLEVSINNLPPLSKILVQARLKSLEGETLFFAEGVFQSDANGIIQLGTQQPFAGSYHKKDPLGLLWEMKPLEDNTPPAMAIIDDTITISFSISIEGGVILAHKSLALKDPQVVEKFATLQSRASS